MQRLGIGVFMALIGAVRVTYAVTGSGNIRSYWGINFPAHFVTFQLPFFRSAFWAFCQARILSLPAFRPPVMRPDVDRVGSRGSYLFQSLVAGAKSLVW